MTTSPKVIRFTSRGRYAWLSNFAAIPIEMGGVSYPTIEHYYQALKTLDNTSRDAIRTAPTPKDARRLGRAVTLRDDFDAIKIDVMTRAIRRKVEQHPDVAERLLKTGTAELVEFAWHNDRFWAVGPDGKGENHLGRIWNIVREELRAKRRAPVDRVHRGPGTASRSGRVSEKAA